VTAHYSPDGEFLSRAANYAMLSQIAFLLFVAATARIAWQGAPSARDLAQPEGRREAEGRG
jgi:hypothetical protein